MRETGILAGPAGDAAGRLGKHAAHKEVEGGQPINPIRNFANRAVSPIDVQIYCDAAIGSLETLAEEAAGRERGVVGLLARFLRFPVEVREAAELGSPAGQRIAFWAAVTAEVLAIVIATGVLAAVGLAIHTLAS
ncbi:MAG TPA: hypothetical protein VI462_11675 [Acidimicrobiia bacterium]